MFVKYKILNYNKWAKSRGKIYRLESVWKRLEIISQYKW